MPSTILEICVDRLEDLVLATRSGAHRIELCGHLAVGGVTPTPDAMRRARELTDLPIMAMVRPRGGGFHYDEAEFELMHEGISRAHGAGADGVVLGCLTGDGDLDVAGMERLIRAADPLEVTFHRAFDVANNPREVLEQLIELGVERLLTSGQAASAPEGVTLIAELVTQAAGRIGVMPGAGLRASNVRAVAEATGARELHGSASTDGRTDGAEVAAMVEALAR